MLEQSLLHQGGNLEHQDLGSIYPRVLSEQLSYIMQKDDTILTYTLFWFWD